MIITVTGITTTLLLINLLCVLALVFVERKDPTTTLAWVLLLSFLPMVGVVFYLLFGRGLRVHTNKRLDHKRRADQELDALVRRYEDQNRELLRGMERGDLKFHDSVPMKYISLVRMNYQHKKNRFTRGNGMRIFTDGNDKFESLLKDIKEAKSTINVMYFIINNDDIGRRLVQALAEKAREGVQVRLCYDDLGSITTTRSMFWPLRRAGGKVCRFFPVNLFTLLRANYRNHRKIVVIDGHIGYMGGMNVGDEYLGLHKRKTPWRDTHLRLTGPCVQDLQARFLMDWMHASRDGDVANADNVALFFPPLHYEAGEQGNLCMQMVASGPDSEGEEIKRALMRLFGMAKRSILIQSPYFIPDQAFLEALQIAAQAGIEVTVMIPGIPDKRMVYAVTTSYVGELLDYGIRVLKYHGFLHAKMIVIDGEIATIGTCNMDMRSFRLHFELNDFIFDSATARECVEIFKQDEAHCNEITPAVYRQRSFLSRGVEGVCRLCAPLM